MPDIRVPDTHKKSFVCKIKVYARNFKYTLPKYEPTPIRNYILR